MNNFISRLPRLLVLASAIGLIACSSDKPTAPDVLSARPAQDIADARNTGQPGFYFLAPIAPALPVYPGVFDGTRSPIVEVCRWSGVACIGAPIATFSRSANTISVDNTAQLYRADWTTTGLAPGVVHRIRVIEGTTELGHADAQVPGAGQTPASLSAQGIVPLGNSSRLAIRFRLEPAPVTNGAPVVAISAPLDGALIPAATSVALTATATDPEQGDLSGQIIWRSNQQPTPLGTGGSINSTLGGGRHTITASVTDAGGTTTTASIQVVVNILSVPQSLNVPYGGTASLPITLSQPAPPGGLALTVSSSAPALVGVAVATVNVPAGAQSANATLQGLAPGAATVVVSNVDYGSATTQANTTASLNIALASVSFAAGRIQPITISLESGGAGIAAPPGGIAVTLTSANSACVVANSPVTIPAGLVNVVADLSYGGSASTPCSAQVTASVPTTPSISSDFISTTVQPSPSLTVGTGASRVGDGLRAALSSISLGAPAPAGGLTITVASSNSSVLLVSDGNAASVGAATATVTVAAGNSTALFYMHGVNGAAGSATVTGSASGYSNGTSSVVTVAPAILDILALPANSTTLTPAFPFTLRVGVSNAAGTALQSEQEVRPGSPNMIVTTSSSDASVARLLTSAGAAQSRAVAIAAGASRSATTVAAGGIAFEPLNGGTTNVSATASGAISATQSVTISAPTIALNLGATRIGAGLRGGASVVSLGAPAPTGGLTVSLSTSNPAVLLVSDGNANSVGTATATVTFAAGATTALFYAHALEGASGTATVSASAQGFANGTSSAITVAGSILEILALPATTTTLTPNIAFVVRSGVVNIQGTGMQTEQEARPGGGGIVVALTNSNASAAQLVNTVGAGQSRTVTIAGGASRSPTSVAAGGVAFDPLGIGTTTVNGTATGFVAASQTVVISAPAITFSLSSTRIGAGLRSGLSVVTLGAPAPAGGVTITLASSNSAILLVSDGGAATVGASTATVSVAAGATTALFYAHALEGGSGTATIAGSATNFANSTSGTITVVPAALEILSLPAATTTLTPDIAFLVRSGASNVAGNALQVEQEARPGGGGITVTLTNSSATIGQLVTTAGPGQSRVVTIAGGASRSPLSVAAGGIAFDPLSTGTTTVGASSPNVISTSQQVVVSAPTFTVNLSSARVGAGLRAGLSSITLGAPAPAGGLVITLASSNAGVLLVSDNNANSIGAATATINAAAGASTVTFYMHGVENAAGTAVITASAPGFTNGTASPTVAAPAVDVLNLPTSIQAGAANRIFTLRLGVSNAAGTGVQAEQEIRPGSAPIVFTVTNSNASAAQLVTSAGAGQSRTVSIAVGGSRSGNTVALGGIAFDPLAIGTTNIATSAAGVISVGTNSVTVIP